MHSLAVICVALLILNKAIGNSENHMFSLINFDLRPFSCENLSFFVRICIGTGFCKSRMDAVFSRSKATRHDHRVHLRLFFDKRSMLIENAHGSTVKRHPPAIPTISSRFTYR